MHAGVRFTTRVPNGMFAVPVNELRKLRRAAALGQREFAEQLSVALETFRTWDRGRRCAPTQVMERARLLIGEGGVPNKLRPRDQPADGLPVHVADELLSLDHLAREIGVHPRTLRSAARVGRLQVQFSVRSAFGRPIRAATRAAGQAFMKQHYRRYLGERPAIARLAVVPGDYDDQLRILRRDLGLTQGALAALIGAAGKAVVYQWESRKRKPSPVLWERVMTVAPRTANRPQTESGSSGRRTRYQARIESASRTAPVEAAHGGSSDQRAPLSLCVLPPPVGRSSSRASQVRRCSCESAARSSVQP